jgi:hypothetical protein
MCEDGSPSFSREPADLSAGSYRRVDSVHGQGKQHKHENLACTFHPHGRERTVLIAEALWAGMDEGAFAKHPRSEAEVGSVLQHEPADLYYAL